MARSGSRHPTASATPSVASTLALTTYSRLCGGHLFSLYLISLYLFYLGFSADKIAAFTPSVMTPAPSLAENLEQPLEQPIIFEED